MNFIDRVWHSGKVQTLWALAAVLGYAVWEVWGQSGFEIPKDKGALGGMLVLALRLIWSRDHNADQQTTVSPQWQPPKGDEQ